MRSSMRLAAACMSRCGAALTEWISSCETPGGAAPTIDAVRAWVDWHARARRCVRWRPRRRPNG